MKYTRNDFLMAPGLSIPVDEWISVEENELLKHTQVLAVPSCHITGFLHFDGKSHVTSELSLEGVLVVEDSITGDDLEIDFETESETVYSFDLIKDSQEEDAQEVVFVKKDTIDINPEIFQAIVYEAPMSITRLPRDQYPKGNGWILISDQDPKPDQEEVDPRWAKLKDFQFNDD